jgi:hypothetical protein
MELMPALVDWSEAVKRRASGTLHVDLIDALDDESAWVRDIDLDNDSAYVLSQADVFDALATALDPAAAEALREIGRAGLSMRRTYLKIPGRSRS